MWHADYGFLNARLAAHYGIRGVKGRELRRVKLPDRQRLAVVLRHLEERANPEIAEIMGLSVEAVESLLSRGRRALKAGLAAQAEGLGYKDE